MRQDQFKLLLSALSANSVVNEMGMSCICTIAGTLPASPDRQHPLWKCVSKPVAVSCVKVSYTTMRNSLN
jgi:hypothetical protein